MTQAEKAVAALDDSRVMSPTHGAMGSRNRASSLPPETCPFWSDRVQADQALEWQRPVGLSAAEAPVPEDAEWDGEQSPQPIGTSSDVRGREEFTTPPTGTGIRTQGMMPGTSLDSQGTPGQGQPSEQVHERDQGQGRVPAVAAEEPLEAPSNRLDGPWNRWAARTTQNSKGDQTEGGLAEALGVEVVHHLQEKSDPGHGFGQDNPARGTLGQMYLIIPTSQMSVKIRENQDFQKNAKIDQIWQVLS